MSSIKNTASVYAQVALLRRRVLFRHATVHALLAATAMFLLITGCVLLSAALFLALRQPLGDIGAMVAVAVLYFASGSIALTLALREPTSPELAALATAEVVAFDAVTAEATAILTTVRAVEAKLERVISSLTLGERAKTLLERVLKARSEDTRPVEIARPSTRSSAADDGDVAV
jgi:hypothetical protein